MPQGVIHQIDCLLIHQARKFITAANVHFVKTWIFCYETSAPNSPRRERYETLLHDFVASNTLLRAARLRVERDRRRFA
jgi:hypothetical protein